MNTYDIYKNGKLDRQNVVTSLLCSITGLNAGNVYRYTGTGNKYKAKDGAEYHFEVATSTERPLKNLNDKNFLPQELKDGWENMTKAAQKIKKGTHHIETVFENGKYVRRTVKNVQP